MKKLLLFLFGTIILYSCSVGKATIERINNLPYTLITDSIYTKMPGALYFAGDKLIWMDPFDTNGFAHVIDEKTKKELFRFGAMGDGPEEFNLPLGSLTYDSKIMLYDLYKNLQAFVRLDGTGDSPTPSYEKWQQAKLGSATRYIQVGEDSFLSFHPTESSPFAFRHGNRIDSLGKLPFSEKIENGYDIYQGEVVYNPATNMLLYSTYSFPYVAMYQVKENTLKLRWEKLGVAAHQIQNDQLKLDTSTLQGLHDVALSKDFIIGVQRDEEIEGEIPDKKNERDMAQLPHSLFIYDYDYQLLKIINLGFPILRVAADAHSNKVVAMIINEEFNLIKFEIE